MTLNCDRLVLLFDEHKISGKKASGEELPKNLDTAQKFKSVTATGTVKVMQQDLKAVAGRAVFDGRTRTITLTENPRVWEGPRRMAADTFIIYPDENRAEALGKIKVTIDSAEQKKANENEQ
jgi:lipopolysaccharide export system protein LptA